MKKIILFIIFISLVGCATTETHREWRKTGTSREDYYMDSGQCKEKAFAATNKTLLQIGIIYNACMQGKGWHLVEYEVEE